MTLSEFIKKRLDELGMKRSNLINDYDLAWSTLSNIDHDKPINKVTQEKLAKALQCSQARETFKNAWQKCPARFGRKQRNRKV